MVTENHDVSNNQLLQEIQRLRKDFQSLSDILIGCAEKPDTPGLVERVRILEGNMRIIKWIGGIIISAVVLDVVVRAIALYRLAP